MSSPPRAASQHQLAARLIAHRGMPLRFPENTLLGFRAALQAGAQYLETDVQLSADGVAVLSHDASLRRVAGIELDIPGTPFARLRELQVACAERFGDRYTDQRLATLDEFVSLLQQWPAARAFIEIKPESYVVHGAATVARVLEQLRPLQPRSVVISFEPAVIEQLGRVNTCPAGWILPEWSEAARQTAERLAPQFLFVACKRVPAGPAPLWPGPWQWVVYTVNERAAALAWQRRGFQLIETDCIGDLLQAGS
jgi:glycerophosphoryl diester phosphodiesterase